MMGKHRGKERILIRDHLYMYISSKSTLPTVLCTPGRYVSLITRPLNIESLYCVGIPERVRIAVTELVGFMIIHENSFLI
jgi:hypothetical protein